MNSLLIFHSKQLLRFQQILLGIVIFFGFIYVLRYTSQAEDAFSAQGNFAEIALENERETRDMKREQLLGGSASSIPTLKVAKARYDSKRLLRIYDFHYTGDEWDSLVSRYDVCFATQTSVDRIYWLPYILEKWTGPLSVAVYLANEEEWLILNLFMSYLSKCHVGFRNQVAMHLAVPANVSRELRVDEALLNQWSDASVEEVHLNLNEESCPEAKEYLKYLLDKFPVKEKSKLKLKEVYPQNHMRNIARNTCGAQWTYTTDIDIIPRSGMANMLYDFYESRKEIPCEKCAYVIPTFELNETFPFPESKKDLVKMFEIGTARQYNKMVFSPAQDATDYQKWTTTNIDEGPTKISHEVLSEYLYQYEPFYISAGYIPPFDERFVGFGYNRSSQFTASIMAGWRFFVLTSVYSIHWGLQTPKTVLFTKKDGIGTNVRENQTQENDKLYRKFRKELELKKDLGIF